MKRWVVLLLLVALPARTVLAVAGFGCAMTPTQLPQAHVDGAPCASHAAAGEATTQPSAGNASENVPTACPSCTAVCCAALAPMVVAIADISSIADDVSVIADTSFANAVAHTLDRPPRLT